MFSGQGAQQWGGRWNRKGTAAVYTAAHRSLAILELLVHIKGGAGTGRAAISSPFYTVAVSFAEDLLQELPLASLPPGWNAEPCTAASQEIGSAWVAAGTSPVLGLPSVIVPDERNYLLNPDHPRFVEIQIGPPVLCHIDPRLL